MVSQVLLTTLFVGALLSYQVAPVTSCGWDVNLYQQPRQQPKCHLNLFGAIGKGLADVGKGIGDVAAGIGTGVGNIVHGVGYGLGQTAAGVGAGVGDLAIGVGHGLGEAAVGLGKGVGNLAVGVGLGLNAILGGVGQCLFDVGHGLGLGLSALFHGCHWHTYNSNHGAIRIGLPGASHLAKYKDNGAHITFTSSYANGRGKITFYFTRTQDGQSIHEFKKDYYLNRGTNQEVKALYGDFVNYVENRGHTVQQREPQVSGNIVWSTKYVDGRTIITLTYSQYSDEEKVLSRKKSYVLCNGSQEEVKNAIAHFKSDLQAGNV